MGCRRPTSFLQLLAIWTLIFLTSGKSFSHARRVLEVSTVVATDKEFAVHAGSSFSTLQKENTIAGGDVPSAAAAEAKTKKVGGRKMSYSSTSDDQKGRNAGVSSLHGEEKEGHWRGVLMDFAADYTSPRAHPPTHN